MHKNRRILFIVYDQFELLDLAGPSSVFNGINALLKCTSYDIHILSAAGGLLSARSGIEVNTQKIETFSAVHHDTILVVGGGKGAVEIASSDPILRSWLRDNARNAERVGSICSGALLLAAQGLLKNKKATTHWADAEQLQRKFPHVKVEPDALYCNDGNTWTSAGVTTGIDMTLAMVAADHDHTLSHEVARWLVVYAHRPGNQSQFSELLTAQHDQVFSQVMVWLEQNMHKPIKVSDMAEICAMTERTFYRKFTDKVGCTPAKFVEQRRLQRAKQLLEEGATIKNIHSDVGYGSKLGFRNAFVAKYGMSPALYKRIHVS